MLVGSGSVIESAGLATGRPPDVAVMMCLMTTRCGHLRLATVADGPALLSLWAQLFDDSDLPIDVSWEAHAHDWFNRTVDNTTSARFPLIEVGDEIVAAAIGTLELGVPNPYCPRGRTVRLANVITLPDYRGSGYGTALVHDVIARARLIGADRVDLSSTAAGQRIYERTGFSIASAPRMKLIL
ncbi:MAG: GNAT family N-acetyltransferase [Actinomycetota bacterium]|nr:GNAT family N-acetyltransferase [Actinomycetota bacterium]